MDEMENTFGCHVRQANSAKDYYKKLIDGGPDFGTIPAD